MTNFSRRIKLLVIKKKTNQASRIKTKRPPKLWHGQSFLPLFSISSPIWELLYSIKLLLWIAKSEGTFPNVGGFIYCLCSSFHYPEIFLPRNILLLSGLKI